jgi:hypothetical protein
MSEPSIILLVPTRNLRNEFYESGERLPVIGNAVEQRSPDGQVFNTISGDRGNRPAALRMRTRRRAGDGSRFLRSEHETAELREQFIAVLIHDLRNPPTAISAGARNPAALRRSTGARRASCSSACSTLRSHLCRTVSTTSLILCAAGWAAASSSARREPSAGASVGTSRRLRRASPGRIIGGSSHRLADRSGTRWQNRSGDRPKQTRFAFTMPLRVR